MRAIALFLGVAGCPATDNSNSSADDRVIDYQHDNRTDDGHEHAVEIEPGYAHGSKEGEQKASDDCTDYAEHNVEDDALARLIDDPARDEASDETEDQPSYDRHEGSFLL
jgi:hypothetical protein